MSGIREEISLVAKPSESALAFDNDLFAELAEAHCERKLAKRDFVSQKGTGKGEAGIIRPIAAVEFTFAIADAACYGIMTNDWVKPPGATPALDAPVEVAETLRTEDGALFVRWTREGRCATIRRKGVLLLRTVTLTDL